MRLQWSLLTEDAGLFVCLCHKALQAPNVINMFIRLNKYECLKLSVNGLCGCSFFFLLDALSFNTESSMCWDDITVCACGCVHFV